MNLGAYDSALIHENINYFDIKNHLNQSAI